MVWLASFPRSGNTFLRNILFYCYGLKSSTLHDEPRPLDEGYDKYAFVKTHLLPSQLTPSDPDLKAVYLVRDGRDAMVSIAWHRHNIVAPGSDYLRNLREAIEAKRGSFFGGWSANVRQWIGRADLIIRFEDLVKDPVGTTNRIRLITQMPKPNWKRLPTFESQKTGDPEYGSGKYVPEGKLVSDFAIKNFRRGESGIWKEELPQVLQDLFWDLHGDMMEHLGYRYDGTVTVPQRDMEHVIYEKMFPDARKPAEKRVLIEGSKLILPAHDGVKRYLTGLISGLSPLVEDARCRWKIDILLDGKTVSLKRWLRGKASMVARDKEAITTKENLPHVSETGYLYGYEQRLIALKVRLKKLISPRGYRILGSVYRMLPVRPVLRWVRKSAERITKAIDRVKPPPDPFAQYDLIHVPLQQHFEPFLKTKKPLITTIHDLTYKHFPEYHEERNVELCELGMKFIAKHKGRLIAVSQATKQDVIKHYDIKAGRIDVTHEATDRMMFELPNRESYIRLVRQKYGIPPGVPYLLCLSTIEPRKNLDNTVAAFNKLVAKKPDEDLHLVIAGEFGWKTEHLSDMKLPRVHFTGFIEDRHLAVIYSQALALCYVSFYEGFGLPPLEAMTCRIPIIYGNNSSLPEVVAAGGLGADPYDVEDIMEKMERIYRNPDLREELAVKAWRQSFKFSWRRMAAETLDAYDVAIGGR